MKQNQETGIEKKDVFLKKTLCTMLTLAVAKLLHVTVQLLAFYFAVTANVVKWGLWLLEGIHIMKIWNFFVAFFFKCRIFISRDPPGQKG